MQQVGTPSSFLIACRESHLLTIICFMKLKEDYRRARSAPSGAGRRSTISQQEATISVTGTAMEAFLLAARFLAARSAGFLDDHGYLHAERGARSTCGMKRPRVISMVYSDERRQQVAGVGAAAGFVSFA